MSSFDDKAHALAEEVALMTSQYQLIQKLKAENEVEQSKIVEQNLTIKHTIEGLQQDRNKVDEKETQLNEREKQIIIKEKQNVLLDKKIAELQDRTADVLIQERKLKLKQEEYEKNNAILTKKTEVYQKLEEMEKANKTRLRLKEVEIDKELERVRNLST